MDSTQELIKEVEELKKAAWRNAKPLFDEQVARCVSVVVVDLSDGTILYSTPPVNQMFGYLNGGLDGKNITDLMPERFRKAHVGHLNNFSHNPKPRQMGEASMELFGLTKDDVEFRIEISLFPTEVINKRCVVASIFPSR